MSTSLYHEAQRRASQPQALHRHSANKSLLLTAPNNIIFELFNTVIKELTADHLLEFFKANFKSYLDTNWTNKIVLKAVKRLKREQTIDFKAGLSDSPRLKYISLRASHGLKLKKSNDSQNKSNSSLSQRSPASHQQRSPPIDAQHPSRQRAIEQVYEHIMWRINNDNVSQITSLLVKLVLDDGYKRAKLKAELYDDIWDNFINWRANLLIKLYAFGQAPANDQKLLLASTNRGDLTRYLANYIDGSEKKQNPDLIRTLASALRDKTKNCILITNDLRDAIKSYETQAIRCALVIDRLKQFKDSDFKEHHNLEKLVEQGKIYILESLNCLDFAPDPTNDTCC